MNSCQRDLLLLVLTGCAAFSSRMLVGAETSPRRPNFVVLLADDLGYGELGCQGNPQIPTPHIDGLATAGIRFTDGYVTAPFCSASRAGLMSGRYQARFGYEFNPIGAQNDDPAAGLPPSEKTLARCLFDTGYTTALFGKWHLGGTARYHPLRRGFDEFFGFLHEGHFFVPPPYAGVTTWLRRKALPDGSTGRWTRADGRLIYSTHLGHNEPPYDANNPLLRGGQPVAEQEYLTDALTREAVDFIARCGDRPFLLYLSYNAVHSPMQATDRYLAQFADIDDVQRRIFAAMLKNLDDSVGAVLQKLDAMGLRENTLIFFLSDNGGPTRELTSSNLPLRGEKGQLYEGGIRVPFMMQWPDHIPAGRVYHYPVTSLDLFATMAPLAAAQPAAGHPLDGVNLIPFVTGQQAGRPHELLYWRLQRWAAVRVGDWKLVRSGGRGTDAGWQLYDLATDIGESRDLATAQPDRVAELSARWEQLNHEMIDPVWTPR